jgi:hypothetical protein
MSPAPAPILRLDGQRASVGEEGWRTARVEENDVVAWPPPSCPYECDETSKPFARVDRVKREGFEGTRQFDRFDCCVMRDAKSRSGVAGVTSTSASSNDASRRSAAAFAYLTTSDRTRSGSASMSIPTTRVPLSAIDAPTTRPAGLRCCTARTMNDGRRVEAASR